LRHLACQSQEEPTQESEHRKKPRHEEFAEPSLTAFEQAM
jgi:hypothetical protein